MKKTALMALALATLLTSALLINSNIHYVSAHQTFKFGNINIESGWTNEPALAGQLNTVLLGISTASDNKPVANAISQLQIALKKGGDTKPLDLIPLEQEGFYGTQVIPTQIGKYELVLKGTINGQNIDGTISIDDVEDVKQFSFPAGGSDNQVDSAVIDQFRSAITDLTSQVDDAKASAAQAQQAAQSMAQSTAGVKASADGAYIFGMIGVGVGVAGVVIAVIALSRREKVEGEKVSRF